MSFVPPHWDTLVSVSVSVPVIRLCIGVSWATRSKKKRKNTATAHLPAVRKANEETCPSRSEMPLTDPMLEGARRPPLRPRIAPVGSYNGLLRTNCTAHSPHLSPPKNVDESGVSTCPRVQTSRTPSNSPLVRIVQALSFSLDRDKSRLRCAVPCSVRAPHTEPPVWRALRRRFQKHMPLDTCIITSLCRSFQAVRFMLVSLCPSVVVQVKTPCPDSLKTTEGQATEQAEQQQSRQWLRPFGVARALSYFLRDLTSQTCFAINMYTLHI